MSRKLRKNLNIISICLVLLGITTFLSYPSPTFANPSSNLAKFKIFSSKNADSHRYPLNFLGTKAELNKAKIFSRFIKIDREKDLYVIEKGAADEVKKGMEFFLIRDNVRVANFQVIETKENISVLKLKRKFPEIKIKEDDLVITTINAPTAFLPPHLVNPRKIAIENLSLKRLLKIAIKNSAEVYEAKIGLDEAWQDYKYAKAKLSPRIWGGIRWDTEFGYRDLVELNWLITPYQNEIITKKLLLIEKYKALIEKAKYRAVSEVLDKYLDYVKVKEKLKLQKKLTKKLQQEKNFLSKNKSASPILINRISNIIKQKKIKQKILQQKEEKSLEKIAITLGYPPQLKLNIKQKSFPGIDKIYSTLNSLVYIPKGGFKTRLAEIKKDIKLMDHYIAKEKTYPRLELTLGFPSLIGGVLPKFPLAGQALKDASNFLYKRQTLLLKDIKLKNKYNIVIKKINISFRNRLIKNINRIKELALSSSHSAKNIEEISLSRKNYIKALKEKHKLRWKNINFKIDLIKLGVEPSQWNKEIPVKEKLPHLQKAIKEGIQKSYILKAAHQYKEAVHPYLIESKKRFHKRTEYWEAVLGEREALIKILEDKTKKSIIKNWIKVIISYQNSRNNKQLVNLAKEKLQVYKNKEDKNTFDILDSKLDLFFTQFNRQKKQLEYIVSFLEFKQALNYKVHESIPLTLKDIPPLPEYKKIEKELTSNKIFNPEAKIKRKIMQLKKRIEKVELAQKGWWIGEPITVRYMGGLPGGKTFEWENEKFVTKESPEGIDIKDWLGIQFPISIFYRTLVGDQIHEVRKAKINMEMQHFKNELYNEKLKMLWDTRHTNLKESKEALKKVKNKLEEAKREKTEIRREISLLKANKLDLISQDKLYLLKKNRYAEYLKNYFYNYIDVLSIGEIYKPGSKQKKKDDFVLLEEKTHYPKLKLIEMKSKKIEEAYKQAKKQKIVSWFYARINRIGLGSSITLKPDISKTRAKMRVKQTKYYKRKEGFDADRKFSKLSAILQSLNLSQRKLQQKKEKLNNLLNYLQKEIEISLSTREQTNELKNIINDLELQLTSHLQAYREEADKVRQLLGLSHYINLSLPTNFAFSSFPKINLKKPEELISNSYSTDPELLLQVSQVELTKKEQKLIRPNRDLSLSLGGELGIIGESIGALSTKLWLFDPTLRPQKKIFQKRKKKFKLKVTKRAQNLRKKIYNLECNNRYYLNYLKKQAKALEISSNIYNNNLSLYKQHKIRWDGEYGLKSAIKNKLNQLNAYLNYFKNYQKNYRLLKEYIVEFSKNKDWFNIENLTLSKTSFPEAKKKLVPNN